MKKELLILLFIVVFCFFTNLIIEEILNNRTEKILNIEKEKQLLEHKKRLKIINEFN